MAGPPGRLRGGLPAVRLDRIRLRAQSRYKVFRRCDIGPDYLDPRMDFPSTLGFALRNRGSRARLVDVTFCCIGRWWLNLQLIRGTIRCVAQGIDALHAEVKANPVIILAPG
jgi:hypothetical protein